jgi:hypothetical protein
MKTMGMMKKKKGTDEEERRRGEYMYRTNKTNIGKKAWEGAPKI